MSDPAPQTTPTVTTDDQAASLVDPDRLTELERGVLDIYEQRGRSTASEPESPETTELGSPVDEAEAPEVPTEQTVATDIPTSPGAEDTGPNAGEGEQLESDPITGQDEGVSAPFTFAGIPYTEDQLSTAVQVHQWFSALQPDQINAIDALMSGQYQLTPITQSPISVAPQPAGSSPPAGPPSQSPSPAPALSDEGDWLDPRAEQEINALRAEIAGLRSSLTPVVASQQQAQLSIAQQQIDAGAQQFAAERSLTPEEMDRLTASVTQAQIFPTFAQRRNGDLTLAMKDALDTLYWTTPEFRNKHVQQEVQSGIQQLADLDRASHQRQQQLTALSGAGGTAPRTTPAPKNRAERHQAMVDEIAAASNGNGQIST